MTDEQIDRLLANEPPIEPSRGFTDSVMRAVYSQADQNSSIPFPWRRLGIALGVCLLVVVVGVMTALRTVKPSFAWIGPEMSETLAVALSWLSVTLAGTYALTWISRRWI
jgi:hypothetical protein